MNSTTRQPDIAGILVWDGQRTDDLEQWLDGIAHHFDDGQLVLDALDDERVQRPDIGWLMIRWTDGSISMASGRIAERVYGEHGLYGRLRRAEEELARRASWMSTSCPGCRVRERPGGTYLCYDCWGQLRLPVRRALGRPDMLAMRRLQDLFGQINAGIPLADINIVP